MYDFKNLTDKSQWFDADKLHRAFHDWLGMTQNSDSDDRLYHNFLSGVGNNHAGTYYAVINVVLPAMIDCIQMSNHPYQISVGCHLLIELFYFQADPESFSSEGERLACEHRVVSTILAFKDSCLPFQQLLEKIGETLEK